MDARAAGLVLEGLSSLSTERGAQILGMLVEATASALFTDDRARPEPSAPSLSRTASVGRRPAIFSFSRTDLASATLFAVSAVQRREITRDAGVDLLQPLADLGHREVLVAVVYGFEFAAVDRNDSTSEQVQPTAKLHELTTH
jgi:hypothetical protein